MRRGPLKFPAGVIEGFYGKPWTDAERCMVLRWMCKWRLNTYVYAPKDDLKHRVAWREPYSRSEALRLATLIRFCHENRISFCYAIAPGLDIRFCSAGDQSALRKKIAQIRSLGADSFAMLFDDIPASLARGDLRKFRTPAAAQAFVANDLFSWLRRRASGVGVFFCPTVYCGAMARPDVRGSDYLGELGARLIPEIKVFWTGPQIVSDAIPVASVRELASVIRRRPVLWDNLYANDYDMRRLHLGPYAGRSVALKGEIDGVFLNPNCQCPINFIALRQFAGWVEGRTEDNCTAAWKAALRAWHKGFTTRSADRVRLSDLELLCEFFYLPSTFGPRARRLLADIVHLLRTTPRNWGRAEQRFQRTSDLVLNLFDALMGLQNRDLLHAMYAHIWELKERLLLIRAWVSWRRSNPALDAGFRSPDFPPAILRGAFCAALDSLLVVDEQGFLVPNDRLR